MDEPTEDDPDYIVGTVCKACRGSMESGTGQRCATCNGHGIDRIVSCPRKMVTPEARTVLRLAGDLRHGLPPHAGGALDQSACLMSAIRHVHACEAPFRIKADLPV